jgi:two-component system, NarL family, nitrate/nitrite response regulator NarL
MTMKIVWVDDHELACVALTEYIRQHASEWSEHDVETVPVFTLAQAIEEIGKAPPPDLVFLDLDLNGARGGTYTLERLQAANPRGVPVVVCTGLTLTDDREIEVIRTCLRDHDAQGVLLKRGKLKTMLTGLSRMLAGELWVPEEVLRRLACVTDAASVAQSRIDLALSPREWDVARCIGRGLSGKEIARELAISPGHVRQVSCVIYDKLQVRNRTEAAIKLNARLNVASAAA